jgi:hypothetical protein
MVRRTMAAGLVVAQLGSAGVAAAGEPARAPIAGTAAREAARAAVRDRGPMRGGLKWTGLGLIAGGTSLAVVGAANTGEGCHDPDFSCRDLRRAAFAGAGVVAGTGVLLLAIGHARRAQDLPSLSVAPGRASIQQRIRF